MSIFLKVGWIYLGVITLATFIVCGWDKSAAQRQRRRVPEKTLFLLSILGGSAGMYVGMLTFRHKTQHWYFKYGIPAILVLQIGVFMLLYRLLS